MGNGGSAPGKTCPHHDYKKHRHGKTSKSTDAHKSSWKTTSNEDNYEGGKNEKIANATNPFIIFFLRMKKEQPKERVTVVARLAGKEWTKMSSKQKQKYMNLANAEKRRREEDKKRRRRIKITQP